MSTKCVSIIIPAYNQEKVIERCINSVLNQTYKGLQVIVVNDGSTDRTAEILDKYSKLDTRIEIYHIGNQGVSNSRNYGLSKAIGDYIQFLDGDDYVSETMVEDMVKALEECQADMVVCNYYKLMGRWKVPNKALDRTGLYTSKEYLIQTIKDPGHHYYGVVWNKIYKTSLIRDKHISFPGDVTLGEDFIFNLNYWYKSNSVKVIRNREYYYNRTNNTSLSYCNRPGLEDCLREYHNREKIFEQYIRIMTSAGILQKYYKSIYFYWTVFYIRQKYALSNKYLNWSVEDKNRWNEILENDQNIAEALRVTSRLESWRYTHRFARTQKIKDMVKGLL